MSTAVFSQNPREVFRSDRGFTLTYIGKAASTTDEKKAVDITLAVLRYLAVTGCAKKLFKWRTSGFRVVNLANAISVRAWKLFTMVDRRPKTADRPVGALPSSVISLPSCFSCLCGEERFGDCTAEALSSLRKSNGEIILNKPSANSVSLW